MIMGRHIHVAHDVLALELHVHRPHGEIDLAGYLTRDHSLFWRAASLVTTALLEIRLVFKHDFLARNLDRLRSFRAIGRHACIWIWYRHTRWGGWRLRRCETHIR